MLIPNKFDLYMFIHWKKLRESNYDLELIKMIVPTNVFVNKENKGMSTDWSKYSTPIETQERAATGSKLIEYYSVIGMNVGKIRNVKPLKIKYAPKNENKAHTNIFGLPPTYNDKKKNKQLSNQKKKLRTKLRKALSNISVWEIHFEDDHLLNRILNPTIDDPFNV